MQCYMLLLLRFSIWTERNRPKSLLCFASSCFQIQQVHFPGLFLPKSLLSLSLSRLDSLHWQCIGNWMRGGFKAPRKLGKMYLQFSIISKDSFLLKCLCVYFVMWLCQSLWGNQVHPIQSCTCELWTNKQTSFMNFCTLWFQKVCREQDDTTTMLKASWNPRQMGIVHLLVTLKLCTYPGLASGVRGMWSWCVAL